MYALMLKCPYSFEALVYSYNPFFFRLYLEGSVFVMLILMLPIFLLSSNAIFAHLVLFYVSVFLLLMPDYVLEGSKGTPFEGKDHTYYTALSTPSNICFVTYNL
jgi:hypothetical protein